MKNINSGRKRDLETLFKALTTIMSCSERTRNGSLRSMAVLVAK